MSVSRIKHVGTIFSRVDNLIKAGALAHEHRPLWFDIYKAYPPLEAPIMRRKVEERPTVDIVYKEDFHRVAQDDKGERDSQVFDLMNND